MPFGETFGTSVSMSTTSGTSAEFHWPVPVIVEGVVAVVDTAPTVTAPVQTISHTKAGSAAISPSGAAEGGTITIPVGTAEGLGVYKRFTPFIVLPGERLHVLTSTTSSAGSVWTGPVVRPLPFNDGPTNRSATTPGATTQTNYLGNLTEVTS